MKMKKETKILFYNPIFLEILIYYCLEMKIEKQTKGGFITQGIIMQKKSRIYY